MHHDFSEKDLMQSQAKDEALTLKNIYLSGKELRES
jgi:hypothetical protein